jgi:hypothetical protein
MATNKIRLSDPHPSGLVGPESDLAILSRDGFAYELDTPHALALAFGWCW